ncbi:hypothetical protein RHGRI_007060 [Rhododendron griersonianum]|uniref:Uncharacterized protein n=1 Tax=Rhododendron griersonianum TaxID=479676 RepID=A0AAV6KX31_9ERIC|nr:hypothetical protein RHGRI_007060 [Rhododendron griersonianum]
MSVMVLWSDVHLILSIPSLFYLHFLVRKISILLFEYGLGYESDVFYLGIKCRWDIIAEKLGFMLVFGDLVWIPFTFSIQGWWLLSNKVELTTAAVIANCIVFWIGFSLLFEGIEFLEALTSRSMYSKRTQKRQYGVNLPRLLGESCLLLATDDLIDAPPSTTEDDSSDEWDEFGDSNTKPEDLDPGSWCPIFEPTAADPAAASEYENEEEEALFYSGITNMVSSVSSGEPRLMEEAASEIEASASGGYPHAQSALGFLYNLGMTREWNRGGGGREPVAAVVNGVNEDVLDLPPS